MRVQIESLACGYEPSRPVFSGINLEMSSDDGLVCVIGPNGVGKSTLVRCIDNLVVPLEGHVLLDGIDARDIDRRELSKKVGYVQAMSPVLESSTVFETVSMGRYNRIRWRMSPEDLQIVDKAIATMGIGHLSGKHVSELSAGQVQKVMIARGLVQDSEMLILDEPTSNLDIRSQIFTSSLLSGIAKKDHKLIVMISHDVNLASKSADKIVVLSHPGKVLAFGTPQEVVTKENIMEAYGVECDIIEHEGRPNILIRSDSV